MVYGSSWKKAGKYVRVRFQKIAINRQKITTQRRQTEELNKKEINEKFSWSIGLVRRGQWRSERGKFCD